MRNTRRRDEYSDKPPVSYLSYHCLLYVTMVCCVPTCALCSVQRQQNKHLQKIDLEPSQFPPLVAQPTSNGSAAQNSSQVSRSHTYMCNLIRIVTISSIVPIIIL